MRSPLSHLPRARCFVSAFVLWDRITVWYQGWPGTHSIVQTGLQFLMIFLSQPLRVLGTWVWEITGLISYTSRCSSTFVLYTVLYCLTVSYACSVSLGKNIKYLFKKFSLCVCTHATTCEWRSGDNQPMGISSLPPCPGDWTQVLLLGKYPYSLVYLNNPENSLRSSLWLSKIAYRYIGMDNCTQNVACHASSWGCDTLLRLIIIHKTSCFLYTPFLSVLALLFFFFQESLSLVPLSHDLFLPICLRALLALLC